MSNLFKFSMFFTSFIPLWITVIFKDVLSIYSNEKYVCTEWISIILIMIVLVMSITIMIKGIKTMEKSRGYSPYKIISVEKLNGLSSEYLLAYVVPLFAFDFTTWFGAVEFLVYFLILMFLCVKNNNVYSNLILEIQDYKFYNCELQNAIETQTPTICKTIISKQPLSSKNGHVIDIIELDSPFYLGK